MPTRGGLREDSRRFVEENSLENLAQVFARVRYPRESNERFSESFAAFYTQGFKHQFLNITNAHTPTMKRQDFAEIISPWVPMSRFRRPSGTEPTPSTSEWRGSTCARGRAANFTLDDLRRIVSLCSHAGVKTYLTVNTIIYDDDIPLLHDIVDAAAQAGISAIIAADPAAISCARSKGVEVHISTQANISNIEAVELYAQW